MVAPHSGRIYQFHQQGDPFGDSDVDAPNPGSQTHGIGIGIGIRLDGRLVEDGAGTLLVNLEIR